MAQNISAAVYGAVLNGSFEGRPSNDSSQKLEECQALYQNETVLLQQLYPGEFCKVSYDQIFCWPPTPHNTTAQLSCFSEFFGIRYDDTLNKLEKLRNFSTLVLIPCRSLPLYPGGSDVNQGQLQAESVRCHRMGPQGTPLFFIIVWVIFKSILEQHDQSDAVSS
ncbi:hypothetical protein HUJ04_006134 [Dendroctonus ponderosae]|nr:hypothetical protein HUJ04_006134 [Dendroctonus ponderosae]